MFKHHSIFYTVLFSFLVAFAIQLTACGDEDDDGGSGDVLSCTLNASDTDPYSCVEASRSLCGDDCTCEATPPNTAEEGTSCPGGSNGVCTSSIGTIYYYNTPSAQLAAIEMQCTNDLSGTWTAN